MKHIYTVFTIQDPDTNAIKYVGFTTQTLMKRFCDLQSSSKRTSHAAYYTALSDWLRKMDELNKTPIVKSAFDSSNKQEAEEAFVRIFNENISPDLLNRTIIRSGINTGLQFKQFEKPITVRRSVGKRASESKSAKKAFQIKSSNINTLRNGPTELANESQ